MLEYRYYNLINHKKGYILLILVIIQMKKQSSSSILHKGFTLLEILLVVAIISILAGIVIVAINPAKQLGDARNAQRKSDVQAIVSAVYQYIIDNNGAVPPVIPNISQGFASASSTCKNVIASTTGTHEICKSTASSCTTPYVNLTNYLATSSPNETVYLSSLPSDPSATTTDIGTGYYIGRLTNSGNRIIVCAPLTENQVGVTGMIGIVR